ncbi:MAG TPA: polysaccharide deacetylase family protein [Gemmatimonadales bacterium]|nr:polysaccharide deacetylase family protein [Gemmatimonadales bacterium]
MSKPIASVSLDLDDLWTYQRTHGDPEWERRGSYLPRLMPPLLDLLDAVPCRITFFLVGADAVLPRNAELLRAITARGHEVGNHSYNHECWLHRYDRERLTEEIASAEAAIEAATGERPVGFRGPGFSWSPELFEVLAERGYLYDASTLPTYLGPLARAYFLASTRMSREERKQREVLFGSFRDGLRPVHPYRWRLGSGRDLLEIPVTTVPGIKTPFHMSYLIYLGRYSVGLMRAYLRAALSLCRRTGVAPSFLLHPLDFLGLEDAPQLSFFPGMAVPATRKRALVTEVLGTLAEQFALVPMSTHASHALRQHRIVVREAHGRRIEAAG